MIYRALADAVVLAHLGFVVFALLGGLLVWRRRAAAWLHLPAAIWATLVEWLGLPCPLTQLEDALRAQTGEVGLVTSFVERHLVPVLYPAALTRELQLALGAVVVGINVAIYLWALHASRRAGRA